MKKSSDQTFMLAKSCFLKAYCSQTSACSVQSALTPVRSVECGLFA